MEDKDRKKTAELGLFPLATTCRSRVQNDDKNRNENRIKQHTTP